MRHAFVVLSLVAVLAGCSGSEKKDDKKPAEKPAPKASASATPLCERLGGYPAIKKVVKDFVENYAGKDDRIDAYFTKADIPHLEQMVSEQLGEACGCPAVKYTGRDMKSVHEPLGISNAEFDAFMEDFAKCLDANGVKPADRDELAAKLAPMREQIVRKP